MCSSDWFKIMGHVSKTHTSLIKGVDSAGDLVNFQQGAAQQRWLLWGKEG